MEVIARKQRGLTPLFILFLAVGALLIGGGVVFFVLGGYSLIPAVVLTVLGLAVDALSALCMWKWKKMPEKIVCVADEKLQLPEGRYAFNEILNVSYRCPFGALKINWGKLYIEFKDKKVLTYGFVEDVAETQKTLLSLCLSGCNAPIDR